MLVVLDEWFHCETLPVEKDRYVIKPIKIGSKAQSLQLTLQNAKPGWLTKHLRLKPYELREELTFFSEIVQNDQSVIYFYEPRYANNDNLLRLRNLLLPDKQLYPIPVYGNHAEALFLIHRVCRWWEQQHASVTYRNLRTYTEQLKSQLTRIMISPEPLKLVNWKKFNAIYRVASKKTYCLMKSEGRQMSKKNEIGELTHLWRYVLEDVKEDEEVWAVCKGISEELNPAHHFYRIGEPAPPVNVPFVHAVISPISMEKPEHISA